MLTTRDVAGILGLSVDGVHKLVQKGRLKAQSQGKGRGRHLIFDTESVYAEVKRRKMLDGANYKRVI